MARSDQHSSAVILIQSLEYAEPQRASAHAVLNVAYEWLSDGATFRRVGSVHAIAVAGYERRGVPSHLAGAIAAHK